MGANILKLAKAVGIVFLVGGTVAVGAYFGFDLSFLQAKAPTETPAQILQAE
jgi:hypothetical protein